MDRAKFFDSCRAGVMGPTLDQDEVSGANAILDAMAPAPVAYCAYALATAWHETAHSMQPIHENGGPNYFFRMYDPFGQRPHVAADLGNVHRGDGAMFHGRGYVQLTGRTNYTDAGAKLGYPLAGNPDLALRPDVAAQIMRQGMSQGWFTGKGFSDFLPSTTPANRAQFIQARRIINRLDRADDIAAYALGFQAALIAGGWAS